MTKLLDKAVEHIRTMSPERQDEAAEILLGFSERDLGTVKLSDDQVAEVRRRLKEPAVYATDEQVAALFQKMGA